MEANGGITSFSVRPPAAVSVQWVNMGGRCLAEHLSLPAWERSLLGLELSAATTSCGLQQFLETHTTDISKNACQHYVFFPSQQTRVAQCDEIRSHRAPTYALPAPCTANTPSRPPTLVRARARNHTSAAGGGARIACQRSDVNLAIYGNLIENV